MTHEAKPQPGTDTISLVMVEDKNGNGTPNYGDTIRAKISTQTQYPWVRLLVVQAAEVVAVGFAGYFDGALGDGNFGLYSPKWTGGAAGGTLDLFDHVPTGHHPGKPLASANFRIDA